jgi:hypothetical protein
MSEPKLKAYKIITHDLGGFGIYIATSAGKAKTLCMQGLHDAYPKADYSWFKSCRRVPKYDYLAPTAKGCVAWKDGNENWQLDKGHWYDYAPCLMEARV